MVRIRIINSGWSLKRAGCADNPASLGQRDSGEPVHGLSTTRPAFRIRKALAAFSVSKIPKFGTLLATDSTVYRPTEEHWLSEFI